MREGREEGAGREGVCGLKGGAFLFCGEELAQRRVLRSGPLSDAAAENRGRDCRLEEAIGRATRLGKARAQACSRTVLHGKAGQPRTKVVPEGGKLAGAEQADEGDSLLASREDGRTLRAATAHATEISRARKLRRLCTLNLVFISGAFVCLAGSSVAPSPWLVLLQLLGLASLYATQVGGSLAQMLAVPEEHRFFAIAASILVMHALGDIPFPIVVGYVKDRLAPHCAQISPEDGASAACRAEEAGLRWTLFFIFSVLLLMAAATFGAKLLSDRKTETADAQTTDRGDTRLPREENQSQRPHARSLTDSRQSV